ncbi:Uncharacterised protein [Mycobacteroides abscessus subsp. massiliense]|nr:Uncharacterised protein [Mycobacteroides abscessus subsp. massiliense]
MSDRIPGRKPHAKTTRSRGWSQRKGNPETKRGVIATVQSTVQPSGVLVST